MTLAYKKFLLAIFMPNMTGGGAERVAVNFANITAQCGYTVCVVLLSATCELLADLLFGVRVVDLKARCLWRALFPLARYLRQSRVVALLPRMWRLTVAELWAHNLHGCRRAWW